MRSLRRRMALGFALLAACSLPAPGGAQEELAGVASRIADGWRSGDPAAFDPLVSEAGLDLSLDGDDHEGLGRRQVRAALERFFAGWLDGEVEVRRAERLGGSPPRALVELAWTPRARGAPERRSFVIFVSLARETDRWRIREIRVFS